MVNKSLKGNDGKTYLIKNNKIYRQEFNSTGLIILIIIFIIYSILYGYDVIKDLMRKFSVYTDVAKGEYSSAFFKEVGLTKGNFMREFGLLFLIILMVITYFMSYSEEEISIDQAPDNIKQQFYIIYPLQKN